MVESIVGIGFGTTHSLLDVSSDAARLAGLNVRRLLNEPTAAALA